jgi:hypothetical protein
MQYFTAGVLLKRYLPWRSHGEMSIFFAMESICKAIVAVPKLDLNLEVLLNSLALSKCCEPCDAVVTDIVDFNV